MKLNDSLALVFSNYQHKYFATNKQELLLRKVVLINDILRVLKEYEEILQLIKIDKCSGVEFILDHEMKDSEKIPIFRINGLKYIKAFKERKRNDNIIIIFDYDFEFVLDELIKSADRTVENSILMELIACLGQSGEKWQELIMAIIRDNNNKKRIIAEKREIAYYKTSNSTYYTFNNYNKVKVKKLVAKICAELGIKPCRYFGKIATYNIRTLQKKVSDILSNYLNEFSKDDMHLVLLAMYSVAHDDEYENSIKASSILDDKEYRSEEHERFYKQKQKLELEIRTIQYLIETNLFLSRNGGDKPIRDNVEYALAISEALVSLQYIGDHCNEMDEFYIFIIREDYTFDVVVEKKAEERIMRHNKRLFRSEIFSYVDEKIDREMMNRIKNAFLVDTGIQYALLMDILDFLLNPPIDVNISNPENDVIALNYSQFTDVIQSHTETDIRSQLIKILEFISIDEKGLMTIDGEESKLLPIYERDKRDNRFELKPITKMADKIVYSPASIHRLVNVWKDAFDHKQLPYEIGFKLTLEEFKNWRTEYQKLIVNHVYDLLYEEGGVSAIWKEMKLHKQDKNGGHPDNLGDYDVVGVDKENKKIWIIECKFLKRPATIHDRMMRQKNFFMNPKKDCGKFQRRIDYMKINYINIFSSLGIEVDASYQLCCYMVTNRVFSPFFNDIGFDVVSFEEFSKFFNKLIND